MGAQIGETPMFISVVTKDLITDTRSDLINDTLRFVPGVVTGPTNESQPRSVALPAPIRYAMACSAGKI